MKEINRNAVRHFFPGTNIVKEERDMIQEYQYQFNVVTDEEVKIPDITAYEKKYINTDKWIEQ